MEIKKKLRALKWNMGMFVKTIRVAWNFWDFIVLHEKMGDRTAKLWGGGTIYLRNFYDLHILLEVFQSNYGVNEYYERVADIGANIGIYSAYYARKFPNAKIDAFEPEPQNFEFLKKNTQDYSNVTAHNVAVGSTEGEMTLYLDKKNYGRHSRYKTWVKQNTKLEFVKVPVVTLRGEYDFIKLDVEGGEFDILRTLPKCKKLVMEVHKVEGEDAEDLLCRVGREFDCEDLGGNVYSCTAKS